MDRKLWANDRKDYLNAKMRNGKYGGGNEMKAKSQSSGYQDASEQSMGNSGSRGGGGGASLPDMMKEMKAKSQSSSKDDPDKMLGDFLSKR